MRISTFDAMLELRTEDFEVIESTQKLIVSGGAWHLEGAFGRSAMALIEMGQAVVGSEPRTDYWGNTVPARHMLEEGTKGTFGYVRKRSGADFERWLRGVVERIEG